MSFGDRVLRSTQLTEQPQLLSDLKGAKSRFVDLARSADCAMEDQDESSPVGGDGSPSTEKSTTIVQNIDGRQEVISNISHPPSGTVARGPDSMNPD